MTLIRLAYMCEAGFQVIRELARGMIERLMPRASRSELRGNYEVFILDRGQLPWSVHSAEAKADHVISLDPAPFTDNRVHESAKHTMAARSRGLVNVRGSQRMILRFHSAHVHKSLISGALATLATKFMN